MKILRLGLLARLAFLVLLERLLALQILPAVLRCCYNTFIYKYFRSVVRVMPRRWAAMDLLPPHCFTTVWT